VTEGPITVALLTKQKKAHIRYTLDGSEPTDDSQRYAGPFVVEKACTVKARTFTTSVSRSLVTGAGANRSDA
jgi:N-acetyl-beta-hexosaminidase